MAYDERNIVTVNRPFDDLTPLTSFLVTLEEVTDHPTEGGIDWLDTTDKTLTDRAVLFPVTEFVHNEGNRVFGYRPCTVSDGVRAHARIGLHEPGSEAFYREYSRQFSRVEGVELTWSEEETPGVSVISSPIPRAEVPLTTGSLERRQNAARGALIGLGGHLAVSGAFFERDVQPAYTAIKGTLEAIGANSSEEDFAAFGLRRIGRDLLNRMWVVQHFDAMQHPIGKAEATQNIKAAWKVVGRPYGRFSGVAAALASRPHF